MLIRFHSCACMYLFVTLQVCSAQSTFRGVSERGKICSLIAVLKMNGYCTLFIIQTDLYSKVGKIHSMH